MRRLILGCICAALLHSGSFSQSRTVVIERGSDWVTVDHFPHAYRKDSVSIGGELHTWFPDASDENGLPQESFLLGIPPSARPTVEILEVETREVPAHRLAYQDPSSAGESAEGARASILPARTPPPPEHARAGLPATIRSQRVLPIVVNPFSYGSLPGVLRAVVRMRIRVRMGSVNGGVHVPDPHFEHVLSTLLVNYDQSRNWRVPPDGINPGPSVLRTTSSEDPTSWYVPGKLCYRVAVANDAIVHLTADHLRDAGVDPAGVDPSGVSVHYKGRSIMTHAVGGGDGSFDDGDVVEFFSQRLRDGSGLPEEYSDTSVYWIDLGSSQVSSASVESVYVTPTDTVTRYTATYHRESDLVYHYGDFGLPTNNLSGEAPGEGWYWQSISAGGSRTYTIGVGFPFLTGTPEYEISVRAHSTVVHQATPNHIIQVQLNGAVIGADSLNGYETKVVTVRGPMSQTAVSNSIVVRSLATGASVNQAYIDWVALKITRQLAATNDTLMFVPDLNAPGSVCRFRLTNFTSADIHAYRVDSLGGIEKVFRGSVQPSGSTFTITFSDTIKAGSRYVAVTGNRKIAAPPLGSRVIGDLRSGGGADYLVVTTKALSGEANRLASYRAQKGIGRTMVVTVEDIYDQFGYGHSDPYAIRRFLRAADSLWAAPAPAYVLFLGDASWDLKDRLRTGKQSLVPSLGNPVSDVLFVSTDANLYLPTKFIGRIPCSTVQQAADMVDRIVAHEALGSSTWRKRYIFMAGGFDSVETKRFTDFSESLVSQYVAPGPLAGFVGRVYRNINLTTTPEEQAAAARTIEAGGVWVTYIGHGGTDRWGNGIDEPEQLRNLFGFRHVISDISCSTVRFAEPVLDSFSEQFLFGNDGGAVAFLGSSGFGYESPLRTIGSSIFQQLAGGERTAGVLLLTAKMALWGNGSSSIITQNSMHQYTLLGDPALEIAVPLKPDYFIDPGQIVSQPALPDESDPEISVSAVVTNAGLQASTPLTVRVTETHQSTTSVLIEEQRPPPATYDTIRISSPSFNKGGSHLLRFVLDPDGVVEEEEESNNEATYTLAVNAGSLLPVLPLPSTEVHPDSVTFLIQNPANPLQRNWTLHAEIDTSAGFDGPSVLRYAAPQESGVATSLSVAPGVLQPGVPYFWRARYEGDGSFTSYVGSYLRTSTAPSSWAQQGRVLFENSTSEGLLIGDTVRLFRKKVAVELLSKGFDASGVWDAEILVDGVNIAQGSINRGYNVAVLNEFTGDLESFGAFSIYSTTGDTTLSEPVVAFLNAIPAGRRVLVAVADEGQRGKSEALNVALEACGSAMIRQLTFRGSWAMIGWKGAPIGSVSEVRGGGGTLRTVTDTLTFNRVDGTLTSPPIGPAASWGAVSMEADTTDPGTQITLDAIVRTVGGTMDTLRGIRSGNVLPQSLGGSRVSEVRLKATLTSDSAGFSPGLMRWSVELISPPELVVNDRSVSLEEDSVVVGAPFRIHATVPNLGTSDAAEVVLVTTVQNLARGTTLTDTSLIPLIPARSSMSVSSVFPTTALGGQNVVRVEVNPGAITPELHSSNNSYSFLATVLADTIPPVFRVTFDGQEIFDGDFVSARPSIRIVVSDENPLPITDPSSVTLMMDGYQIALGADPDSLFLPATSTSPATVLLRPELRTGEHLLSVQVHDISGNPAGTLARDVRFRVQEEAGILNVVNFPNPFARTTHFTFDLVGSRVPDEVTIRIYTVVGRMIRELQSWGGNLRMGFNAVPWDGRDREGNEIANGVYLYKVFLVEDGKSVEVVEKLAKMR